MRISRAIGPVIQLLVRMTAAPGRSHQLGEALRSLKRQLQSHRGCSSVFVAIDTDEQDVFWYCEEWQDVNELEAYLQTDAFGHLLALVETAVQPPLLEFRMVRETRGLDYVADVRGVSPPEVSNAH